MIYRSIVYSNYSIYIYTYIYYSYLWLDGVVNQQTFNKRGSRPTKKKKIRLTKRHDAALQRGLARDELFLAVHRVVTTPSYGEGEFHHIYGLVYQG